MKGQKDRRLLGSPWFPSSPGTASLVLAGLSLVILMFRAGSPIGGVVPSDCLRKTIAGFLFGIVGALSSAGRMVPRRLSCSSDTGKSRELRPRIQVSGRCFSQRS